MMVAEGRTIRQAIEAGTYYEVKSECWGLRIHAVRFADPDKAQRVTAEIESANPDYEAKVVAL